MSTTPERNTLDRFDMKEKEKQEKARMKEELFPPFTNRQKTID